MIKKIELNHYQRELLRDQLNQLIWSHESELTNGGYTPSGILKATSDIYRAAQIIEKLNFDVLVEQPEIDYYEDFETEGHQLVHGKWIPYADLIKFSENYPSEIPQ